MNPLHRQDPGFTLVELLIVVAIIGIIAAIAIPNLLSAIQRGKQKRTMGDIKTIATIIEIYNTDNSTYPLATYGTATVASLYSATNVDSNYLANPILNDGWTSGTVARPFYYSSLALASPQNDYIFCSLGKDGVVDGAGNYVCADSAIANLLAAASVKNGTSFNCDISMVDGQFLRVPLGKQTTATTC